MTQPHLMDLAAAIADGRPINWAHLPYSAADADVTARARILERIAQVHASLPSAESFTASLQASLSSLQIDVDTDRAAPITWGPLTIGEKIGQGTYGDVYRARDRHLNRTVALKLLKRKDRRESATIDEGHRLARLRHPNIVTVYGAERIDGRVGLWMEFVDGRTLEQDIKTRGPLPADEVARIGIDLCAALAAVHQAGLLHRDLKAQNVMRDGDGRIVLTDFGAGREAGEQIESGSELAGTPLYLAPEVLRGESATAASDLYSVGVLLYYLATGSFPVNGRSLREVREAHDGDRQVLIRRARADLPPPLRDAIGLAIASDPAHRYASADDLARALRATMQPRRRHRALWAATAAVGVLVAAIAVWQDRHASFHLGGGAGTPVFVLVTRFVNHTGDRSLDAVVDLAVARELGASTTVSVVPLERVDDALRLMRRPLDTVVDRTIGREICMRDGGISAMIGGSIDKRGNGYALTAAVIDPLDDRLVATAMEVAPDIDHAIASAARVIGKLRLAVARSSTAASPRRLQQVTTSSITAFQLYEESIALGARWAEAETVIRRALDADPAFASGWIQLALTLKNQRRPNADVRDAASRALAHTDGLGDWERHWVVGTYAWLMNDHVAAVREYEAAEALQPGNDHVLANLTASYLALERPAAVLPLRKLAAARRPLDLESNYLAAFDLVRMDRTIEAQPYIDRVTQLLPTASKRDNLYYQIGEWHRFLPAYLAWTRGSISEANDLVERAVEGGAAVPSDQRWRVNLFASNFYMTYGRMHDAERLLTHDNSPGQLAILDEAREDVAAMRTQLLLSRATARPERYVKAGLLAEARRVVETPSQNPLAAAQNDIGRGALELAADRPSAAIAPLESGMAYARGHFASEYHSGCDLLATALIRLGRQQEMLRLLEQCVAVPPRYVGFVNAAYWMTLELRLADAYRAGGRVEEARRVEDNLRKLLAFADADDPLLTRLNAR